MFREQNRTDEQFPELSEEESYPFKGEMPEVGDYVMVEWCETFETGDGVWTEEHDLHDQFLNRTSKYEGVVTVGIVVDADNYGYMAVARDMRDFGHGDDLVRRVIWIPYRSVLEICPLRPDPIDDNEWVSGGGGKGGEKGVSTWVSEGAEFLKEIFKYDPLPEHIRNHSTRDDNAPQT